MTKQIVIILLCNHVIQIGRRSRTLRGDSRDYAPAFVVSNTSKMLGETKCFYTSQRSLKRRNRVFALPRLYKGQEYLPFLVDTLSPAQQPDGIQSPPVSQTATQAFSPSLPPWHRVNNQPEVQLEWKFVPNFLCACAGRHVPGKFPRQFWPHTNLCHLFVNKVKFDCSTKLVHWNKVFWPIEGYLFSELTK